VRIPRDPETFQHLQIQGLYPCGEGAGYAGGIISAAIDGEKCAIKVKEFLGEKAEIILTKLPKSDLISPKEQVEISTEEKEQLLIEYLKRRPAPLSELTSLFFFERELQELLEKMVENGKIRKVHHQGNIFYTAAKENSEN
ncbi:MAG: hypothetical protein ACK40E_05680, partial [Caldimicrobium sp.]